MLIVFFSFSFIPFVSPSEFGYNILEPSRCNGNEVRNANGVCVNLATSFNNNTAAVNSSEIWITNVGALDDVNSSQFYNGGLGGTLSILESFIASLIPPLTNPFDQDLNTTNNVNFMNVTVEGFLNGTILAQNRFIAGGGFNDNASVVLLADDFPNTDLTIAFETEGVIRDMMRYRPNDDRLSFGANTAVIKDVRFLVGSEGVIRFNIGGEPKLFIANSGFVGIGLMNPTSQLHVNGSNNLLNITTNDTLSRLFVGGDGNVGIGTSTPTELFNVKSDAIGESIRNWDMAITRNVASQSLAGGQFGLRIGDNDDVTSAQYNRSVGITYIQETGFGNNAAMGLWTGGNDPGEFSEKMRILSSGKVGINATSPSAKLDIRGTGDVLVINNSALNAGDTGINIIGARDGQSISTGNLNSYIKFSDFDQNTNGEFIQAMIGGGQHDASINTGYLGFDVNNGSGLNRALTIDKNGNVGISTTIPLYDLDVRGNITLGSVLNFTNGQSEAASAGFTISTSDGIMMFNGSRDQGGRTGYDFSIDEVNNEGAYTWWAKEDMIFKINFSANGENSELIFRDGTDDDKFYIGFDGNVSIGGYLNQSAKLNIMDTGGTQLSFAFIREDTTITNGNPLGRIEWRALDGGSQVGAKIEAFSGGNWGEDDSPADLVFYTAPDGGSILERMRILDTGLIGIGTTNPSAELEVVGDINLTGTILNGRNLYSTVGILDSATFTTSINVTWGPPIVNDVFYTSGFPFDQDQVTIDNDGLYRVVFDVGTDVSSGLDRSDSIAYLLVNNVTLRGTECSMYNRLAGVGINSCSMNIIDNFDAGDVLIVQIQKTSGTDTLIQRANSSRFNIEYLGD